MALVAFCMFAGALKGRINFQELPNKTIAVMGTISGLPPGLHGFHVHEYGNLGNSCMDAGSHFNPANLHHGGPDDAIRHAGDMGNINSDASMNARIHVLDDKISLDPSNQFSILNRTLVVHENLDDLGKGGDAESLKTGNAGKRIDCCIITRSQMRSSASDLSPHRFYLGLGVSILLIFAMAK